MKSLFCWIKRSIDEEKLRLFEENYQELEKLKQDLAMNKEREERSIRVKYENELKIFEKQTEENFIREKKFLETRQINQLNILKQTIEKEKLDLQNKLRFETVIRIVLYENFFLLFQSRYVSWSQTWTTKQHEYSNTIITNENRSWWSENIYEF